MLQSTPKRETGLILVTCWLHLQDSSLERPLETAYMLLGDGRLVGFQILLSSALRLSSALHEVHVKDGGLDGVVDGA